MPKSSKPSFRNFIILLWLLVFSPLIILSGVIFFASKGWIGEELPTFEELENPKSNLAAEVLSSDQVVLGKYYKENPHT